MSSSTVAPHSEPFLYSPSGADGNAQACHAENSRNAVHVAVEQAQSEGFARGVKEGEARARLACDGEIAKSREHLQKTVEAFANEREEYFQRIEPEVVRLALAIAKKILHREAQIDPLLLTGLVHVALEKLDAGTKVRLRANPAEMHFWIEHFAQQRGATTPPELAGDPTLAHGECVLETELGNTQISLDTQVKEIEQGFFDLLEQRPRIRP